MDTLYKKMKADGMDVLGFAAGEPDFPTPDNIKMAGISGIVNNATKYTPATGTLQLKEAICHRCRRTAESPMSPARSSSAAAQSTASI